MADIRKLVKVFLASPGDLTDERKAAKSIADEFNDLLAEEFGYQVELVGWEDTVSVFGRPQATINRELERCELFVGMMWKHWGTPPDHSGPYTSGFEEEFRISVDRRLREGRPEISLLFKEIDPEFLRDRGPELTKVLAFKDELIAGKQIYFENFTPRDFEKKFRRCITTYIRNLRAKESNEVSDKNQAPTPGADKQQMAETDKSSSETPLSAEGALFLREFISKTECDSEQEPIEAVEVARFRLLANLLGNPGNDERFLGPHDANLLFAERRRFKLGDRELTGLLACGFKHYSHENVPLWHWYAAIDGFKHQLLPFYSLFGESTEVRVGALAAMKLISEPLPSAPPWDRERFLQSWFAPDAANGLKVAALGYLGSCGITSDLAIIRREFDRSDNQTNSAAADAIIRISLQDSREKAILALYELQPSSISRNILVELFENGASLSIDTLLEGVGHRNSKVRRMVVRLLRSQHALPTELAEKLMDDNDADVRYEALMSLVDNGRIFSDTEAEQILIKKQPSKGILGGLGLAAARDSAGEDCWKTYRLQRLRSLSDKELEEVTHEDPIFDRDARFILAERHFKRYGDDLRKSIDDQYKATFSHALDAMAKKFGGHVELMEKLRSLEEYIRKDLTRQGLDVICGKAEPGDLGRVRTALKSGFVDYSDADVEYLRRFGEWEDISLIIDSVKRPLARRNSLLLPALDDSKYLTAARTIYALGRIRLPEVLTMEVPTRLLSQLIVEIPDKAFCSIGDHSITLLLRSEDDAVRRAAAIKCVRALPKRRVARLLTEYTSGNQHRYYNVVHWLDFGISTPKDRALPAAEKNLNNAWQI